MHSANGKVAGRRRKLPNSLHLVEFKGHAAFFGVPPPQKRKHTHTKFVHFLRFRFLISPVSASTDLHRMAGAANKSPPPCLHRSVLRRFNDAFICSQLRPLTQVCWRIKARESKATPRKRVKIGWFTGKP